MKHRSRSPLAFTFIEVMAGVVIAGILGAIAVATFTTFRARTELRALEAETRSMWEGARTLALSRDLSIAEAIVQSGDWTERTPAAVTYYSKDNSQWFVRQVSGDGAYAPAETELIIGHSENQQDGTCVVMVLPEDPTVDAAPAGGCDELLKRSIEQSSPDGWWRLAGSGNAEAGPELSGGTYDSTAGRPAVHEADVAGALASGTATAIDDAADPIFRFGEGASEEDAGLTMSAWIGPGGNSSIDYLRGNSDGVLSMDVTPGASDWTVECKVIGTLIEASFTANTAAPPFNAAANGFHLASCIVRNLDPLLPANQARVQVTALLDGVPVDTAEMMLSDFPAAPSAPGDGRLQAVSGAAVADAFYYARPVEPGLLRALALAAQVGVFDPECSTGTLPILLGGTSDLPGYCS